MIELKGLKKSYRGRCVVDIDHLVVKDGELLAILGPNGAGKSTLLRLLHFIEPSDEGTIFLSGQAVQYPASLEIRRSVSMVFQRPMLFNRTVKENVAYGLRMRGRVDECKVEEIMNRLDLMDFAHENARSLSGGEIQRVALARTLVLEPEVLILDEPTANLDPFNAALIESIINEVRAERNTTIILVSHNVSQAVRLADRIAMILAGEIIEIIDGDRFLETAKDPRTESFIVGAFPY